MAADLTRETPLFLLKDVPKQPGIPARRAGSRLDQRTCFRWATRGLRGVVLESVLIGGQRYTSGPALARFFAAVTAAGRSPQPARHPAPAAPARDRARVESELDRLGL